MSQMSLPFNYSTSTATLLIIVVVVVFLKFILFDLHSLWLVHQGCNKLVEKYPGNNESSWLLDDTLLCLSVASLLVFVLMERQLRRQGNTLLKKRGGPGNQNMFSFFSVQM